MFFLFPGSVWVCPDSGCGRSECYPPSTRQVILTSQKKDYINTLGILIWSLVNGQSDSLNFFGELIPMKAHLYNFYENGKKYFIFQILFCWYQKGILLWNKYFVRSRSKAKQPNSLVKTSDFLFQLTWLAWFSCNIRDTSMTCVTH